MTKVALHQHSPAELKAQLEAERGGVPFLVYRDGAGQQSVLAIGDRDRLTIGRDSRSDISLDWDGDVSRLHAELECLNDYWTVADDGLSRNGTFLNGERVRGRRRMEDRDRLRIGKTTLTYRDPRGPRGRSTVQSNDVVGQVNVTDAERQVLIALARPYASGGLFATPASNRQIAEELYLSLPTIKGHLRSLFAKYRVQELPQVHKRVRLVELAFESGEVREHDLVDER